MRPCGPTRCAESMVRQFQANDRDGNASITVEEFAVRYEDVVSDLDRNGDGELTRDELRPPRPRAAARTRRARAARRTPAARRAELTRTADLGSDPC